MLSGHTTKRKGGFIGAASDLALAGRTAVDIRAALRGMGATEAGIKTTLNRLRKRGKIAPRVKLRPTYYQITLHPAANDRLVNAARARGLLPADLARIWLHLASRELT